VYSFHFVFLSFVALVVVGASGVVFKKKVVLIQVFVPLLFVVLAPLFVIDVFLKSLEVIAVLFVVA
jgi:hypothetical protein